MDNILKEINELNKAEKLNELRKEISKQYEESTGKKPRLTDEQLLSILDAHEQDGILGELTLGQLRQKVKTLSESITDPKIRRFLLEAGFCGSNEIIIIGKTNVEYLEELGIKIPETSKDKINKTEFYFQRVKDGTINSISPNEFEILVNSHIEFPKSLITPELVKKILDGRSINESRILIENFSRNNDADLFNSILKEREERIIESIKNGNGFISKYEKLTIDLKNFKYNENNIDEFRKILEIQNNEIPIGFRDHLIELFPNKSNIEGIIEYLKSIEISDIIIDYHFEDISYNVFLDIKELLNFQISNGITIPIEHIKIYRDILNIDMLSTEEKLNLHNKLKTINVIEMFYNDYSSSRDKMYQEIADSILNKEKLEKFKDNELSEEYGISIYKFDGQEFFALERESKSGKGTTNTGDTKGFSFSLVGKNCIGTRTTKGIPGKKPLNGFVYEGLNPKSIIHIFPTDSWTNSGYQPRRNNNKRHNGGQIACTLMSPTELLKATEKYNEIFVLRNGIDNNGYGGVGEMKPIAVYCYDEITQIDIENAKRENVGIMLIKTDAYKKNAVNPEWGEDFTYDNHIYVDGKDRLDNAIYSRDKITEIDYDKLDELTNGRE